MVEGDADAVMREVERAADLVEALADMAQGNGNRAIALLARDAGETLLALLDGLAAAERGAFGPGATDRSGASSGRPSAR